MSLDNKKINEINEKKIISFLHPLLIGIQDDENLVYNKFSSTIDNKVTFPFNKSFVLFSDIQCYRHVSILGILNTFDRSLKYEILNSAILLDVWYNESSIINKDALRTCDLLIIHGTNDEVNGFRKAAALIDLINTRKSYGKLTWIFINGCTPEQYTRSQVGVLDEIKNIYNIELKNKLNLSDALSSAGVITIIEDCNTNSDSATSHIV